MKAFIDFYNSLNIIPVAQNIDSPNFISSRNFLYSKLGVPIIFLKDLDILEFGPGGGFNASATSSYKPSSYYFVDMSKAGIVQLNYFIKMQKILSEDIKIFESEFLEFTIDKLFDLVIAEGCIPGQHDPKGTLLKISNFVKNGGILITTTTSKSSTLSEILRVLYAFLIRHCFESENLYIDFLESEFTSHLTTLGPNTRSIEDWVLDNIINPTHKNGYIFSILDVLNSLENFEIQSTFPSFQIDLSWYKNHTRIKDLKDNALDLQIVRLESLLFDYRISYNECIDLSLKTCERNSEVINVVYDEVFKILNCANNNPNLTKLVFELENLRNELPSIYRLTVSSIGDFIEFLNSADKRNYKFTSFKSWWGRGQQYISLRKVA
jgi:SAM-dependent methyltransferase